MEIDNEIIRIIKSKIPLYNNSAYFKIFKDILINCTMESLKNDYLYFNKNNNSKNKLGIIPISKYEKGSLWINIMKNIYISKEVKNYNLKKDYFIVNKQYSLNQKEKKEENCCYTFFKNKRGNYETNNLVISYLSHLCKIKLQKLNIISKKEKTPLTNIVRIYLALCAKNIGLLNIQSKKKLNIKNNEDLSDEKKIMIKKLILQDEQPDRLDKKENSLMIRKKSESKFMKAINNIKYVSNLKKRLAIKNIKNKEKDKNTLEKNKQDELNGRIDKEEEKVDKDNFSEDLNNEEFIKSLNILNKKNKNVSSKILYSSSFTRLFIGETDLESIKERYLSNIDAKKEEKMDKKIYKNKHYNSTEEYLRKFSNRIIQYQNSQLPLIEKNLDSIYTKFRKNQEIIDKYKRISNEEYILEEKENEEDDYNKENLNTMPQYEKKIKTRIILDMNNDIKDANKDCHFTSLTNREYDKYEISKTPERNKDFTINNELNIPKSSKTNKNKNNINNWSFNKRRIKDTIKHLKKKGKNKKISAIHINNKIFPDFRDIVGENVLLTERNNSSKIDFYKTIFENKLFRNKDEYMNNKGLYFNRNLTSRRDRNLYDKKINSKKYQKTKNYFTKKDFYF